ncbi:transposase [Aminobacter lissarensis]|uniref:Transposase n=2 Tax=Aminobacter carboxidus TaxID=376165 RepID=A0A8E1WK78_9HYPH|nr:IS110 family transposase [Aminobacter lissarensis]MBB6470566.1 transposase [Aminobacter lissarensis]
MTIHHSYIGCDIAKAMIDVFDPVSNRLSRVANEAAALADFAGSLAPHSFVVFEATGHHDKALRHALARAGIACARLNPTMVRRFAQARGRLAKTDRIDARILSEMGAMFRPVADKPPCPGRERLTALARRRDQLVEARALELRHLGETTDVTVIADIEAAIASLSIRIVALETEISHHIETLDELAAQAERLTSAPGIGPVTALTLVAHMPELGTISPKAIASLAGLAPCNNDSGAKTGRRSIRGGRPRVRKALYMAALGAVRANQRFKAFYDAIAIRSGSKKSALIAVARKLLTVLNAMQRDQKPFA